jgi:hypothetical protein
MNLMNVWRGGEPRNIMDSRFLPRKDDVVYLVPKSAQIKMRGYGEKIAEGWKPTPYEVHTIAETGQDMYQAYLDKFAAKTPSTALTEQGAPKTAGWTPSRVKNLLSSYADFYEPDRTKALATRINPRDFLGLTLPQEFIETFDTQVTPLDMQRLGAETQPLFLRVSPLETGELRVTGHEGRHRMAALRDAGVDSVPIVVGFDKSATRGPLEAATLLPEQYIGWQPSGGPVGIRDALPISDSGLEALLKAMRGDEGFEFKIGGFAVKKPRKHKHQRPSPFASASNAA